MRNSSLDRCDHGTWRLAAHGIPNRPGQASALVHLAQDMPPAVLAPLLDLHIGTAEKWRRRAATDWTACLEARTATRPPVNVKHATPTIR
ncbi:hypothetical protein ACFVSN_30880 [Kitasatospora sp. NPDC057904]|uniref:hypothetical protein n=1 Tax=Kitasatospora sp. NPDC057904 TaxID=3346275 RepID=UPI0036D99706